jgi:chromosome segregation ATPase
MGEKLKLSKEQLDEYAKIKDQVGVQTAESRKEYEVAERRLAVEQEQLARLRQEKEDVERKITQLKDSKKQMRGRADRLQKLIDDTKAQINEVAAAEKKRQKEEEQAKNMQKEYTEKLEGVQVCSLPLFSSCVYSIPSATIVGCKILFQRKRP